QIVVEGDPRRGDPMQSTRAPHLLDQRVRVLDPFRAAVEPGEEITLPQLDLLGRPDQPVLVDPPIQVLRFHPNPSVTAPSHPLRRYAEHSPGGTCRSRIPAPTVVGVQ